MKHIGVVFVGHGTRSAKGMREFHEFTSQVKEKLCAAVEPAGVRLSFAYGFLELVQPDITFALKTCYAYRVHRVLLVPFFLFDAGHMNIDIPAAVLKCLGPCPGIPVDILKAVGFDQRFIHVTIQRIEESRGSHQATDGILLLGRGNKEASAQQDFAQMAEQVRRETNVLHLQVGYLAGSGPAWRHVLDAMVHSGHTRLLIQPYLWFHGRLTEQLPHWISEWRSSHHQVQTVIGLPLGIHPVLVEAMAERVLDFLQIKMDAV